MDGDDPFSAGPWLFIIHFGFWNDKFLLSCFTELRDATMASLEEVASSTDQNPNP
jgi:hypothetical protein